MGCSCAVASIQAKAVPDGYTARAAAGRVRPSFESGGNGMEVVEAHGAQIPIVGFGSMRLKKAKRDGRTRHSGVCNHTVALLDEAWAVTKEPLVNNQIEVHPFLDQTKVIDATRRHGMSVTAYCPIARGRVPGNEVLERIGR